MCHMSHVTCHMSHVTCHISHVTCHMSQEEVVELVSGGSVINGAYPVKFLVFLPLVSVQAGGQGEAGQPGGE